MLQIALSRKDYRMSAKPNGTELINSLAAPAYTIAMTSRLTGITRWSITRYLRGYNYKITKEEIYKKFKPPIINQSQCNSTYASFLDLVDLLYIKEFLNRGFSLQRLRLALSEAKEYLGSPHFARSQFYTHSDQIILKLPKNGVLIALMTGGQYAIPEIAKKLNKKLDFEDITEFGFARRWFPKGKTGNIVIDPQISFGRPSLIGYGVATANIYDLFLGENEQIIPVSEWFGIPTPKIKTAVQFERNLWV